MAELIIGNSVSQIKGLDHSDEKKLRKILSYNPNPVKSYFSKYGSKPQQLMDKRGFFPTGLIDYVPTIFNSTGEYRNLVISDTRIKPKSILGLFDHSLLPEAYLEQREAVIACQMHYRGIVSAVTGVGKSVIAGHLVKALSVPTLIVVPTLALKKQLTESFRTWFGVDKIGPLGVGPITIENIDSLPVDKNKYQLYQCLIIDEFHRSAAKTYRRLNIKAWDGIFYRFGLTATPIRSQDNEQILLESILSEVIYEIPYEDAVSKGYIVPVQAYYVELPKQETTAKTWAGVYEDLVVNNDIRNEIISILLLNAKSVIPRSALCLVRDIAHGEYLKGLTNIPFASGAEDNSDELIAEFCKGGSCLIGTTGILGTGVDTKPAELIILAAGGKSPIQLQQNIGRGLRKYPGKSSCTVIMFKDPSHRFLLKHFKEQVKVLKEVYGIEPIRLEVL
jgi:superfamily II DNA or RNA helicase